MNRKRRGGIPESPLPFAPFRGPCPTPNPPKETPLKILLDADGSPGAVKEILFRAAERTKTPLVLVANRPLRLPDGPLFTRLVVGAGLDVADAAICEICAPGDLVVTEDVPLAAKVVEKGALALSPHGEIFDEETVGERLAVRNFMAEMRSGGLATGGPPPFGPRDREAFANALNGILEKDRARRKREEDSRKG